MEQVQTHDDIENLDEMMQSRSSDLQNYDEEEDRDSVKHAVKAIGIEEIQADMESELKGTPGRDDHVTLEDLAFPTNLKLDGDAQTSQMVLKGRG